MKINSIAISGVLTLDMHALNNEGTEGNYSETRQVEIIDKDGQLFTVNAISGDMFKHILCEHMFNLATSGLISNISLCEGCKVFDANRINADNKFLDALPNGIDESSILTEVIKHCGGDDLNGILITQQIGGKKRSIGRKSISEFSWVLGLPDNVRTENYFHVKFDTQRRKSAGANATGANLGQSIFYRPGNSGQYAIVFGADLYRIGQNDISQEYVLDETERKIRAILLLQSLLHTFLKPEGAQRNTQNPHIVDFKGILSISSNFIPAPTVSPLNSEFLVQIEKISETLNNAYSASIELKPFNSLAEFTSIMENLIGDFEL